MEKIVNLNSSVNNIQVPKTSSAPSISKKSGSSSFQDTLNSKVNDSNEPKSKSDDTKSSNNKVANDETNKSSKDTESASTSKQGKDSDENSEESGKDEDAAKIAIGRDINSTLHELRDDIEEEDIEQDIAYTAVVANSVIDNLNKDNLNNSRPTEGIDDIEGEFLLNENRSLSEKSAADVDGVELLSNKSDDASKDINIADFDLEALSDKGIVQNRNNIESNMAQDIKSVSINSDINSPEWGDEFAQKVHVLINVKTKEAKISMNPRELGPIKVQIEKSDSDLKVAFNSSTSRVSEVIESNLNKLRDLVENEGMNLLDVSVYSNDRENKSGDQDSSNRGSGSSDGAESSDSQANEKVISINDNIIDFYA